MASYENKEEEVYPARLVDAESVGGSLLAKSSFQTLAG
jgi:hypothetical protein